ncbi:putative adenosylhomocysteine nucleosidase [Rosa chinensis]|uniref:Putative adenosylhomocysteine nucleosidase n=1 Tax=Rosa chinensis TaxID=74649 RepID=A0A2P6SJ40_ROSCH|nr:bark storage protein A [Rosa chinensis]PRQ58673.1 putative adenosylhomocysteine nucleosidase [Rosa chinensis]
METTMAPKQVAECLLTLVMINLLVVSSFSLPLNRRSLKLIQEINRKGPYIGLITVYPPEEAAFFNTGAFKPNPKHPFLDFSGRRFRVGKIHDKKVVYVRCGVGMVNAAAATQQMLDLFDVVGIVHFGISGNANNSMSIGDVTIPQQLAHTGIWDWANPNRTLDLDDVAQLDFEEYNEPKGGENLLGHIGFRNEQFYSESGNPNIARPLFWAKTTRKWLQFAAHLEGVELVQCVNSSLCLPQKPKLVVGLRGSTGNTFVDNAAYRNFLFQTFHVSSVDMESSAVVMTSLSNGFPVIVIRGLSDLAGRQAGENPIQTFGPLAAINACKVVVQFIKDLPEAGYV